MAQKLPLVTIVKNMRCKMLPDKILRNRVAKNKRTKMLLKKLPLATFVKQMRSEMLPEKH